MKQNNQAVPRRGSAKTRAEAFRSIKRTQDTAERIIQQYVQTPSTSMASSHTSKPIHNAIKLSFLGGLEDVGEKNMAIIEYNDEAIILDCGNSLGINLPGVNYTINDTSYLDSIKHKIKAYVITHGHLDHIGGLRHIVPQFPAPIYGSRYTIGLVKKAFEDQHISTQTPFTPQLITTKLDDHVVHTIGSFGVEFIRVTHSLPDAAALCISTPAGKIIATGDFRLDPEPLDNMPSDTTRLKELGDEGVLLLLSDSSYADTYGRVPTESTLQQSFHDIIGTAKGRIFVAAFSSNMNRTQMILNAAVAAGRHVALDGRGMLSYAEIAVRQGILKIPKGTVVPIQQAGTMKPEKLLVMCTGGQGEPNAALQRMSEGQHRHVNLDAGDTVVISSSPIPGNEISYDRISNLLKAKGVHLFRHPTHEVDGCGPLHVSGHARRDELREMIQLTRPKFFIPVHAGTLRRSYHAELAVEEGIPRVNTLLPENGDSVRVSKNTISLNGTIPHGSVLIDQDGMQVHTVVIKDRLLLQEQGIVTIVITIDGVTGTLASSPDILSRGFIAMKEHEDLLHRLRKELTRAVAQRYARVDLESLKTEIRDYTTHYLFDTTSRSPIVIPVINVVNNSIHKPNSASKSAKQERFVQDQKRFASLRAQLLR